MNKKYRIVFLNLRVSEEIFKQGMSMLGVGSSAVDEMVRKAPVVMKEDLTLPEARKYADAVQNAGGRVNIREGGFVEEQKRGGHNLGIKPFEDFTMCPECGYKQLKVDICVKCGFVFQRRTVEGKEENE